jgi:hypothetical protein
MAVRLSALHTSLQPVPQGRYLVLISTKDRVDHWAIVRLGVLGQLKNLLTSLGIEPSTFRLVAECLNQVCYHVPLYEMQGNNNCFCSL